MTDALATVRRGLARADDALLAVRDSLTPGQRWTSALLAAVALALLLAGAPTRTIVRPGQPAAAATPATPRPGPAPAPVVAAHSGVPDVPALSVLPAAPLPEPTGPAPAEPAEPTPEEPSPPANQPAPAPPEDDGGDGDGGGAPPCPAGIPLVVAEAGLCRRS